MTVVQPQPQAQTTSPAAPSKPWSDVAIEALQNAPASAGHFVTSLAQPFIHPVDTVDALADIGTGVVSKGRALAQDVMGIPHDVDRATVEAPANAVGKYFADRYGSVEGFKNALATDPVGVASDVATVASGGAGLPGKAGEVLGTISRVADPLSAVTKAPKVVAKVAEPIASNALGMSTGSGASSVRAAAKAGAEGGENAEAFQKAMRGSTSIDDTVSIAKQAVDQVRQDRSNAYKAGMADLGKDKTVMDFAPIDAAVDKASNVGSFKGASGTAAPITTEPKAAGIVADMRKVVEDWKTLDPQEYHTPVGIDALKRTLGNFRDSTQAGTPERVAADRIYNAVRGELTAQAPSYAKTMEAYSEASDKLKEVTKTLSLGENATGDTAGRKLLSATRTNANTNYGQRQAMIDALAEHQPTLPYAIAGHAMNALAPQGLVGRGGLTAMVLSNPLGFLKAPAFSPRVVGEGAYYAGKGAGMAQNALNLMRINEANARRVGRAGYQTGRLKEEAR
jgi:hypothetical protein